MKYSNNTMISRGDLSPENLKQAGREGNDRVRECGLYTDGYNAFPYLSAGQLASVNYAKLLRSN